MGRLALLAARLGDIGNFVALRRLIGIEAKRPRQVGVDRTKRGLADIAALRGLVETLRRRLARGMRGGEIGAAVERIVRRRLQPGLRSDPGLAASDRWIEQLLERRRNRRQLRAVRLRPRRLRRVLLRMLGRIADGLTRAGLVGRFRHRPNMGRVAGGGKSGQRGSVLGAGDRGDEVRGPLHDRGGYRSQGMKS